MSSARQTFQKYLPAASYLLAGLALVTLAGLALSGPGYRVELWSLGTAFTVFGWAARLGLGLAVLGLVLAALALWAGNLRRLALPLAVAVLAGTISVGIPASWRSHAQSVPPIHDITTDTDDPPTFEAIAPLRAEAPNPVEYAGPETAEQQREAYPDLETLVLSTPPDEVMSAAITVSDAMGWERVAVDEQAGRLEATATTRWFGFKDDVVIRVRARDQGSELDIRSKSRIGRSDAGTNAERIREFTERLRQRLES